MQKDNVKNKLDFFKIPHIIWTKVVFSYSVIVPVKSIVEIGLTAVRPYAAFLGLTAV